MCCNQGEKVAQQWQLFRMRALANARLFHGLPWRWVVNYLRRSFALRVFALGTIINASSGRVLRRPFELPFNFSLPMYTNNVHWEVRRNPGNAFLELQECLAIPSWSTARPMKSIEVPPYMLDIAGKKRISLRIVPGNNWSVRVDLRTVGASAVFSAGVPDYPSRRMSGDYFESNIST